MIPFLKRKDEVSVSGAPDKIHREPDEDSEEEYDGLTSAAEDLCNAIKAEDYKGAAMALRAAFEILESEPYEEGEHV